MPKKKDPGAFRDRPGDIPTSEQGGHFRVRDVVAGYDAAADGLFDHYERLPFGEVHKEVLDLLPTSGGNVLDIGAGSGRDAAWFAANGHTVVAIEPSPGMRKASGRKHGSTSIRWLDDRLPELEKVLKSKCAFDLVWVNAVWHHVPPGQRKRAFRKLVSVLSPGGSMMVSLRKGPPAPGRPMHPAAAAEIEELARAHGLQVVRVQATPDSDNRADVSWEIVWLQLPDDGTGALPPLHHIVFSERKSSIGKSAKQL